jgi:cob(I)alamin adenosyltransferase
LVLLNRIYTRAGDRGTTRLANGENVSKSSARVSAYGGVDELNAAIGLVRLEIENDDRLDPILARVQNDLFDLGADLATPAGREGAPEALRIVASQVEWLEREIDALNEGLEPLNSFVLPGGTRAAAHLHLARTVCRRAERDAVAFTATHPDVHAEAVRYLNRLSDLLFVAARFANAQASGDVLWVPAAGR